jgi:hypothetical protein
MEELAKDFGILKHYPAVQKVKAGLAERAVRTLKGKCYKYVHAQKSGKRYIDNLQDIAQGINNSYSRILKMAPNQVTIKEQTLIFNRLYPNFYKNQFGAYWGMGRRRERPFLLRVGNVVRIVKLFDKTFRKAYRETFSKQLYKIVKVLPRFPPMYQLAEANEDRSTGEDIIGNYYGAELLKVEKKKDV